MIELTYKDPLAYLTNAHIYTIYEHIPNFKMSSNFGIINFP